LHKTYAKGIAKIIITTPKKNNSFEAAEINPGTNVKTPIIIKTSNTTYR